MPAFALYGRDNDSYAYREELAQTEEQRIHQELVPDMSGATRAGLRRCRACGELLAKWEEPLVGLVLRKRRYDVSATYDGVLIASRRFRAVYDAGRLSGLVFRGLPDVPDFFAVQASRVVAFDAERRKTRFVKPCPVCGRHESVVGASPVFLKPGSAIGEREFVRTDLEFGSGDEKHPLLICGKVAAETLGQAKLKGLELIPIETVE